jgi:hypothetical protein
MYTWCLPGNSAKQVLIFLRKRRLIFGIGVVYNLYKSCANYVTVHDARKHVQSLVVEIVM